MARGSLRVRRSNRGETIFEVHRWPEGHHPFVCSSACTGRERNVSLEPDWARPDDATEIRTRLAGAPNVATGAAKGRVLYVIDRHPLGKGPRAVAAALMTVDPRAFRLFRLCHGADVLLAQRPSDAVLLVACARALATAGERPLHMLVPPRADAGDVAAQFNFTGGTFKDRFGQTWLR